MRVGHPRSLHEGGRVGSPQGRGGGHLGAHLGATTSEGHQQQRGAPLLPARSQPGSEATATFDNRVPPATLAAVPSELYPCALPEPHIPSATLDRPRPATAHEQRTWPTARTTIWDSFAEPLCLGGMRPYESSAHKRTLNLMAERTTSRQHRPSNRAPLRHGTRPCTPLGAMCAGCAGTCVLALAIGVTRLRAGASAPSAASRGRPSSLPRIVWVLGHCSGGGKPSVVFQYS
jgi:hypothetical protein